MSSIWIPRFGWTLVALLFGVFVWGLERRARLEASEEQIIRMLFVPSVEQGTLVERGDQLAAYIRRDTGLTLRVHVPTSYAAVIQALGSDQADVAWMPAFAYVIANARYGAEARLQVVRSAERFGILIGRTAPGEPRTLAELAGTAVAMPTNLPPALLEMMRRELDQHAPGWTAIEAETNKEAMRLLIDRPLEVAAAASSWVFSGPHDFVGDGRKELEYERPGTLARTQEIFRTEQPVLEHVTSYHGCVFARVDSAMRRLQDFNGRRFAFSDETSTSGHIFPSMLLDR
ncbi:MAG: PhnD/SsuA/transferrin family substrate-binding protein, partial [Acidobacteriota bacterium]|nr:PhnD/SsuA/transferrin family substrate-binding protein [Acidobacteriota bacterium]